MGRDPAENRGASDSEARATSALAALVLGPTGSEHVVLMARSAWVLGRGKDCDLKIEDEKLSRRHAEIRCGERVEVVDLGSRNGTYVHGRRLAPNQPQPVEVGDSIALGGTVVVVQPAASTADRPRRLWSHGHFEARLAEMCAGDAPFAVLLLRLEPSRGDGNTTSDGPLSRAVLGQIEDADVLATRAPHEYEALFECTPPDEAERRAGALKRALERQGAPAGRAAIATYPRDGRTPEALFAHATRALRAGPAPSDAPLSAPIVHGALARMDAVVERVAAGFISVLILGETGAGKDVLARRIHDRSPRARMPFVSVNCAALSESLLESELFGHEKGAFTGAVAPKAGLIESAHGGTLFLDEVGEMPLATQAKVLRAIEQREVTRVGALRPRKVDVRFLSATNRDLEAECASGRFRRDLFFRLHGIALTVPPLRERVDEIEPLAHLFVAEASRAMNRVRPPSIAPEVFDRLRAYPWPGNVRELKNAMERAVVLSTEDVLADEHLPRATDSEGEAGAPSTAIGEELRLTFSDDEERRRIVEALERCAGNQSSAAKLLGVSRATLLRRLDEHGIARPRKMR